jgi:hypothetical protein
MAALNGTLSVVYQICAAEHDSVLFSGSCFLQLWGGRLAVQTVYTWRLRWAWAASSTATRPRGGIVRQRFGLPKCQDAW